MSSPKIERAFHNGVVAEYVPGNIDGMNALITYVREFIYDPSNELGSKQPLNYSGAKWFSEDEIANFCLEIPSVELIAYPQAGIGYYLIRPKP